MQGRSNAVGDVTLTPNATTTLVDKTVAVAAVNMSRDSRVFLEAKSASAAASTHWISDEDQGSFVINHSSDPAVDRTFAFHIKG